MSDNSPSAYEAEDNISQANYSEDSVGSPQKKVKLKRKIVKKKSKKKSSKGASAKTKSKAAKSKKAKTNTSFVHWALRAISAKQSWPTRRGIAQPAMDIERQVA